MRHLALILILTAAQTLASVRILAGNSGATPLQVTLERDRSELIEPQYRAYAEMGSNQFGFRLPPGYRLTGNPASGTLTLANLQGNGSITFTLNGPLPVYGGLDTAALGNSLSNQYPNAEIIQQFTRNNTAGGGPGFDLQWKVSAQLVQCKRVVYLASPAGVLEFTATAGRANFPAVQADLDYILMSFQCTTDGKKPKVPPIGDKS